MISGDRSLTIQINIYTIHTTNNNNFFNLYSSSKLGQSMGKVQSPTASAAERTRYYGELRVVEEEKFRWLFHIPHHHSSSHMMPVRILGDRWRTYDVICCSRPPCLWLPSLSPLTTTTKVKCTYLDVKFYFSEFLFQGRRCRLASMGDWNEEWKKSKQQVAASGIRILFTYSWCMWDRTRRRRWMIYGKSNFERIKNTCSM